MNKKLIGTAFAVALCVAGTQGVFAAGEAAGAGDKSAVEMNDKGAMNDKSMSQDKPKAKAKHKKKKKNKAKTAATPVEPVK